MLLFRLTSAQLSFMIALRRACMRTRNSQYEEKVAAEREMRKRDLEEQRRRVPRALDESGTAPSSRPVVRSTLAFAIVSAVCSDDEYSSDGGLNARERRKKQRQLNAVGEDEIPDTNLEDISGQTDLRDVITG